MKKLPILIFLCLVALLAIVYNLTNNSSENDLVNGNINATVKKFEDEQTKEISENTKTAEIKIPGFETITLNAGSTVIKGDFFNPDENNVHFQISFYLANESEPFYVSDLIKPSQHLYEININRTFEKGEYDMKIVYNTFSTDGEFTEKNGANIDCKLVVQ